MKQILLLFLASGMLFTVRAQDSTKVKIMNKKVVTVSDDSTGTRVNVGGENGIEITTDGKGDTTRIRIGRRVFDVIEDKEGTEINMTREPREKRHTGSHFNGQWGGIGLGMNMFRQTDYSEYNGNEFFDLNYGKSLTVDINFAEMNFSDRSNSIGLVTGMGFSFMDFRFDTPVTIQKDNSTGKIVPVYLDSYGLKKSKFTVSYLTVPLMLEVATPLRFHSNRLTLAAGIIGGVNIGSHTKIKYTGSKDKEHGSFNISPLKYELTGRIGLGEICLFAKYGMTPLFREGKGPGLTPFVIGISFPNVAF